MNFDEQIALYVLGALPRAERAALDEARRCDPVLDARVRVEEERMAPLALAPDEEQPDADLWDRIEAELDADGPAMAGRHVEVFGDGGWQRLAKGIEFKPMWNPRTILLRCAPGATLSSHLHDDIEHLLVLAGDLVIGSRSFAPGDYIRSPQGTDAVPHRTVGGCIVLQQIHG